MLAYLNRLHLISPLEKEALLKAGGVNSELDKDAMISIEKDTGEVSCYSDRKLVFGVDSESDNKDAMIPGLNSALLLIEKDTGGVTCYFARNFNGSGKPMVIAMSIKHDTLVKELLPVSLRFQDLALSPEHASRLEEDESSRRETLRLLYTM
ncbi:hypothetical protein RND81_04G121700 [Saponaria officinalis]|uniref:Uncharacterized protein n=1 Tax=Saponaria officinalis TaxID=3572 RepID=A0AAW1LKD3_SAPOF